MASIDILPLDIIRRICKIRYNSCSGLSRSDSEDRTYEFQAVAAVCRGWRSQSVDLLYRTALCECRRNKSSSGEGSSESAMVIDTVSPRHWKTNIRFLSTPGYNSYVKELRIVSYEWNMDFRKIQGTLEGAGFGSISWPKIESFNFYDWYSSMAFAGASKEQTIELSQYLCDCMPNLSAFIYETLPDISKYESFPFDLLVARMIGQLTRVEITSSFMPRFNCPMFSPHLVSLCINTGSGSASEIIRNVPKVYAPSLKDLHVYVKNPNVVWSGFYSNDPDYIEFSNLKSLSFHFMWSGIRNLIPPNALEHSRNSKMYKFPEIERLEMQYSPYNTAQFISIYAGPSLKTLCVLNDCIGIEDLDSKIIEQLEEVRVSGFGRADIDSMRMFTQKLIVNAKNAKYVAIGLSFDTMLHLSPENCCWDQLRCLSIESPVCLFSLADFIPHLPQLTKLAIKIPSDLETNLEHIGNHTLSSDNKMSNGKPISSTLKELYVKSAYSAEISVAQIKNMAEFILRLPKLWKLCLDGKRHEPIVVFVTNVASSRRFAPNVDDLHVSTSNFQFPPQM